MNRLMLPVAALFCLVSIASAQSWIRVNQLGYLPHSTKAAVLASKDPALAVKQFQIQDAHTGARVHQFSTVQSAGAYGPFASTWRLDFSQLTTPGSYVIVVDTVRSHSFRIGSDVYDGTADFLLRYMRQQRCGYNPFLRDSCHTRDGYIIYSPGLDSTFIDVTGGWHDAADYLQYVTTSASATYQMLFAYEENPEAFRSVWSLPSRAGPGNTSRAPWPRYRAPAEQ